MHSSGNLSTNVTQAPAKQSGLPQKANIVQANAGIHSQANNANQQPAKSSSAPGPQGKLPQSGRRNVVFKEALSPIISLQPPAPAFSISSPLPVQAAPFPTLPSSNEIRLRIRSLSYEISKMKSLYESLIHQRSAQSPNLTPASDLPKEFKIHDLNDIFYSTASINKIQQENRQKRQIAQKTSLLQTDQSITQIAKLPHFPLILDMQEQCMEQMMGTILSWKNAERAKSAHLAQVYLEMMSKWKPACQALDKVHREARETIDQWPTEFAHQQPKTKDSEILLQYVGPDQPMYLSDLDRQTYVFYDMNALIVDPVKEHDEYRHRVAWTDSEIKTFLSRYALHPREFKKIAAYLPSKSIKEVIEFYDIHRIDLNLKELEVMHSKRGGRKKMISEGSVKK